MSWLVYILPYILPYLPPVISIYLVSISKLTGGYLGHLVDGMKPQDTDLVQQKIKDVALDWGERLGFFSGMIAALFSSISISSPQTYGWAILTLIILIILFIWMFIWIIRQDAGDLVTTYTRRFMRLKKFKMLNSTVCHIILWVVNILLIAEIAIVQYFTSLSINPPK